MTSTERDITASPVTVFYGFHQFIVSELLKTEIIDKDLEGEAGDR